MSSEPYYTTDSYGKPQASGYSHPKPYVQTNQKEAPNHEQNSSSPSPVLTSPYENDQYIDGADLEQQSDPYKWTKGEVQPKRYNDLFCGILFYTHLVVMMGLGIKFIPLLYDDLSQQFGNRRLYTPTASSVSSLLEMSRFAVESILNKQIRKLEDINDSDFDMNEILIMVAIAGGAGFFLAGMSLPLMIFLPRTLIKFSLLWNLLVPLAIIVIGYLTNFHLLILAGFLAFVLLAWYTYSQWERIPFAAANLGTAVTAVQNNLELLVHAYSSIILLFGWSIIWILISVSVLYEVGDCNGGLNCQNDINLMVVGGLLFSFYWTFQIIKNVVHVTVAGTVASWWFTNQKHYLCCFSPAVFMSWVRAVTYNFGSICFGSIFVAILESIQSIIKSLRDDDLDDNVLFCCLDCCLGFMARITACFNQWAFVFVSIYGYNFAEAGWNATRLFRTRGWTTIITDNLADSVLFIMSLGVGQITGAVAVITARMLELHLGDVIPLSLGALIGFGLSRYVLVIFVQKHKLPLIYTKSLSNFCFVLSL